MKVVASFTGTRDGMTQPQRELLRRLLERDMIEVLVHGDCVGADAEAERCRLSRSRTGVFFKKECRLILVRHHK